MTTEETRIYKVDFEVVHGVLFFHPFSIVEAKDEEHAKHRAMQVFNSHPDNVAIQKEITQVTEVSRNEYPNYIKITEVMPWQPEGGNK